MPNFGKGSARPNSAGSRKPRHGKSGAPAGHGHASGSGRSSAGAGKIREDGRGGRSPQRQPFFAERTEETRGARDDRAPRRDDRSGRDERGGREERGGRRDWAPRDDRGGRRFEDRPAGRRFEDRDSRPARDDRRDDRGAERRGDARRDDRRRDWSPREERPARDRRDFGDRDSRPARDDRGADRGPRRFDDRPAGRRFEDRDSGARRGSGQRDFGARRDFDSAERRPDRADRVERDRSRDRSFTERRDSNPNKKAFFEDQVLERLESIEQSEAVIVEKFEDMGLHPKLVEQLGKMGAETPFPIQAATIPAAISGQDVLGRGKTGSGKTIAFMVPIVTKLVAGGSQPRKPNKPRALVLAPTRELAEQIDRTASQLARAVGFYTTTVYGGVPQRKQEIAMSRGVDILVATPGRLEDLMAQRIVDLSEVETIVIDEADHMCDLGFIEGVRRIMSATGDSQKLLFSATLDREVDALVREFLPNPYVYEVPNEADDTANIEHRVLVVQDQDKSAVLLRLVQGHEKALIFVRTKATAESLSESLTAAGVPSARLHGDLNQNQRTRNLERFTRGAVRVLVATDVAARGIHVDDVALVIQLDPPLEYKTYLHRAGRTGRGGKTGTVVTLIPRQRRRRIEDLLHRAERDGIFTDVWPGHELLEKLAGEIAPPPAIDVLDFGGRGRDGRENGGGGRGRSRGGDRGGRSDRPGRSRDGERSERGERRDRGSNYGGNGKGRWADRGDQPRPRDKSKSRES